MAKSDGTDAALMLLLDQVVGGKLTLLRPKLALDDESQQVELTIATRGGSVHFTGSSIAEAANEAASAIASGEEEPVSPAWRRLSRMQRELVLEALTEARARHMRLAAEANVASDSSAAAAEYAKADAYSAALGELEFMPVDREGVEVPEEKLAPVLIPPITPRRRRKT